MTINTTTNRAEFAGDDVSTVFSFPYYFLAKADLVVIETVIATGVQTTKTLTTHYTVSGEGNPAGGSVTMLVAPASTVTLTIYRDPSAVQDVDLVEGDPLPVETAVEQPLDKLTMIVQRVKEVISRSLRLPEGDTGFVAADMYLPAKVARASKYMAFGADGKPTVTAGTTSDIVATAFAETLLDDPDVATFLTTLGVSAFIQTLLDDASAATARATLGAAATAGSTAQAFAASNLAFPAAQAASADPNTLDDYEEGTWTPSIGGTATYTVQSGTYIKIGKLVFITANIGINVLGTGSTFAISGLPFNVTAGGGVSVYNFITLATAVVSLYGAFGSSGVATIGLSGATVAAVNSGGTTNIFGNGTSVVFSGVYYADA